MASADLQSHEQNTNRTLGLFVGSGEDVYGQELIRGSYDALRGEDVRLVVFTSGTLKSEHGYEAQRNVLFSLASPLTVDALVMAGSVSHSVDQAELERFCDRFRPLPMVSLAVQVAGTPAVLTDNKPGMEALMAHLLDEHGYRRIAYLGGPAGQQEAEIRKSVFIEALASRHLRPNPDWIAQGDYTRSSGERAMRDLLAAHAERAFQGVVVANDSMALGAMDTIRAAGLEIPDDLFITGFDDTEEGRFADPPFTTVSQSAYRQAYEATRLALGIVRKTSHAETVDLPARLVIRRSCGCPDSAPVMGNESSVEQVFLREARARIDARARADALRLTGEALLLSHDLPTLLDVLASDLPRLGFPDCHISLFDDPEDPTKHATSLLGLSMGSRIEYAEEKRHFPALELLPGGLAALDPAIDLVMVEALYSRSQRMGCLVFGATLETSGLTGSIRTQISSALQSVLLLQDLRRNQGALEAKNRDLTDALDRLRLAQAELVQSEKLAALGGLVSGIAHEINTPIGVAFTAASYAASISQEMADSTGSQLDADIRGRLDDIAESGRLVETNLRRASDLVNSFKQVAYDQTSEHRRTFSLHEYVNEVIASLRPQWKRRPIEVKIEGPSDLEVDSYPGALAQIITNLMMNTLLHGYEADQDGAVRVEFGSRGKNIHMTFSDDGRGIAPENLAHVFEPFFTTKRGSGGSGLGLHIVYNLVTGPLAGTIHCESSPGSGTTFAITFPSVSPG